MRVSEISLFGVTLIQFSVIRRLVRQGNIQSGDVFSLWMRLPLAFEPHLDKAEKKSSV